MQGCLLRVDEFPYIKQLLCRLVSEVQGVVEEAGGNLKHLSAMEEVTYFI